MCIKGIIFQQFAAELSLIICDKNEKVKSLLGRMSETPNLKILIVMETISPEMQELGDKHSVKLVQYAELEVSVILDFIFLFYIIVFFFTIDKI